MYFVCFSKKDDVVRNEEIISLLLPNLIVSLEINLGTFLKDLSLSRVIATILQRVVAGYIISSFIKIKT